MIKKIKAFFDSDIKMRIAREIHAENKRLTKLHEKEKADIKQYHETLRRRDVQEMAARVFNLERELAAKDKQITRLYRKEEKVKHDADTLSWILCRYANVAQDKITQNIDADRELIGLSHEALLLVKRIEDRGNKK